MNPAGDQTVAFKTAQGLGQHLLRDPADPALQFAVSHRSLGERADHERGPPVGDPVEHLPRGTTGIDDVAISHIDARDIARVAAVVLTGSGHEGKAYQLSGPQALSYGDAAEILSKVIGRKISYVAISDDAAKAGMLAAGMPEFYVDFLVDLSRYYRNGGAEEVTPGVKDVTGQAAATFEEFVKQHTSGF